MEREGPRCALLPHRPQTLRFHNVATQTYTLLNDFAPDVPPGILWQMSQSEDDNTFAFTTKDTKYNETGFIVWRRDSNKVLLKRPEPLGLDEVQVDKTGHGLIIKTEQQGRGKIQDRVADLETGKTENLIDDTPDFAPGHSDNGHGFVIGADNWKNRYTTKFARRVQFYSVLDFE